MPEQTPRDPNETPQQPYTDEQRESLRKWLSLEVTSALTNLEKQRKVWKDVDQLYSPSRTPLAYPLEQFYEYPVPIGAIACDALYAQAFDLIFSLDPPVIVRGTRKGETDIAKQNVEDAKALQTWIDWKVANDINFKDSATDGILSTTKKGTGIYYCPYIEVSKKTKAGTKKLLPRTPIYAIPVDDFIISGGRLASIKDSPCVGLRRHYTKAGLRAFVTRRGWDIDIESLTPNGGDDVKTTSEKAAKTGSVNLNADETPEYQIAELYCRYDIDEDGIPEELKVFYDIGSQKLLWVLDDAYDSRPFSASRYQRREHYFFGLGVVEMLQTFQQEATDLHTQRNLNIHLVNTRVLAAPTGTLGDDSGTVRLWSGRVLNESVPGSIREIKLADVYPSSTNEELAALSLAERRVGANELAVPRPSQLMGSRTPTGTATIGMAQVNRRFAPAFDEMRNALADAVKQTLYRDQERLLAGDTAMEDKIRKAVGDQLAEKVIDILKDDQFDESFRVEMQASTANMNREVERQNHLFLLQVLAGYYDRLLQMSQLAATPGASPEFISITKKVMDSATELIQRVLRSFDQMRDPESFLVRLDEELTNLEADANIQGMQGMQGLQGLLGAALDGNQANALPFGN